MLAHFGWLALRDAIASLATTADRGARYPGDPERVLAAVDDMLARRAIRRGRRSARSR